MLVIIRNEDTELVERVEQELKCNDGYCPCQLEKTPDTKCICKMFIEQTEPGPCHCGRFVKVEDNK